MKKDIRLYYYDHGTLKKWGRYRKDKTYQHFFDSYDGCMEYIHQNLLSAPGLVGKLITRKTFVVVEYTNPYESEIICLVNKNKVVYL